MTRSASTGDEHKPSTFQSHYILAKLSWVLQAAAVFPNCPLAGTFYRADELRTH